MVLDVKGTFGTSLNGILQSGLVDDSIYSPYNGAWAHKFTSNPLNARDFWTNNLTSSNFSSPLQGGSQLSSSLSTSLSNNLANSLQSHQAGLVAGLGSQTGAFGKLNGNSSSLSTSGSTSGASGSAGSSSTPLSTPNSTNASLFNGGYSSYTPPDTKPLISHLNASSPPHHTTLTPNSLSDQASVASALVN